MAELSFLQGFLVAIALGVLIGLEREFARYRKRGHDFAGIRTFPLISLAGALSAYLGSTVSPWFLIAGLLVIGILIAIAYFAVSDRKHIGATSEIAAVLTFFIGVIYYNREFTLAIVLTVLITVILYARSMLHHFAERISKKELGDMLKFLVIAFVVLPFLPNKGFGPLELFNPYVTWLMVVLISGIGFVGYAMMKWFGEKGITLAGLLGGLVSSTATTISFAQRSAKERRIYRALALGVILANGVMFIRILVEVFAVNRDLFFLVLFPIVILAAVTAVFSYFIWMRSREVQGKMELGTPLALKPALKFAVIFAVILALVKVADAYLSSKGVYLVSFLSGIADVDAITLSLSQLAKSSLAPQVARDGILIAALTNIAVKGGIAWWLGGKEFRRIIAGLFAVLIVLGVLLVVIP